MAAKKLTKVQRERAERLFGRATSALERSLGKRLDEATDPKQISAEERAWHSMTYSDGECEYTLSLEAVRRGD